MRSERYRSSSFTPRIHDEHLRVTRRSPMNRPVEIVEEVIPPVQEVQETVEYEKEVQVGEKIEIHQIGERIVPEEEVLRNMPNIIELKVKADMGWVNAPPLEEMDPQLMRPPPAQNPVPPPNHPPVHPAVHAGPP